MRYLLRPISRRRHDRARELCANPFALESHGVWLVVHGNLHVHCLVPRASSSHLSSRALARLQLEHVFTHHSLCRPPLTSSSLKAPPDYSLQPRPHGLCCCNIRIHLGVRRAPCSILDSSFNRIAKQGTEQTHALALTVQLLEHRAARCDYSLFSLFFFFGAAWTADAL
jgi:hypothetical protein